MRSKLILTWVLLSVLVRYLISLSPYSGYGKSPMYGDYEAQRHWMEITTNLPVGQWYHNTTDNDLLYWGLDYPPLTAYHSWVIGKVAHHVEPASMKLFSSRGYETPSSKIFMRLSVIISDVLLYLPVVYLFVKWNSSQKGWPQVKTLLLLSMPPALLLIDHGHFQYNGVSLGLAMASFVAILNNSPIVASVLFCLSLNFKQMSLYYATTIFFYLLGTSINKRDVVGSLLRIAKLGLTVMITFAICWLPFLSLDGSKQVLTRVFPVARGLFEDKVANFWCAVSPFIKFKTLLPHDRIVLLSTGSTIVALLPSGLLLLFAQRPSKQAFLFALSAASLGFFLFSFQVHEKSILIPLIPVLMLMVVDSRYEFFSMYFQWVATFSMYPLLYKDGLVVPYYVSMVVLALVTYHAAGRDNHKKIMFAGTVVGALLLHLLEASMPPPPRLPDLFVMLMAIFSFLHFFGAYIYMNYLTFRSCLSNKTK